MASKSPCCFRTHGWDLGTTQIKAIKCYPAFGSPCVKKWKTVSNLKNYPQLENSVKVEQFFLELSNDGLK